MDTAALGKTRQTQIPTSSNSAETEIAQLKQLRLFKIAKAEYIPDFIVWKKLFQKSKVNITLDVGSWEKKHIEKYCGFFWRVPEPYRSILAYARVVQASR